MLFIEASRAARASAIWRAVSGLWGRVGDADVECDEEWEALLVVGGREGEMEGAFVDVDADAEAEADIIVVVSRLQESSCL
jgi:hypothetical protein